MRISHAHASEGEGSPGRIDRLNHDGFSVDRQVPSCVVGEIAAFGATGMSVASRIGAFISTVAVASLFSASTVNVIGFGPASVSATNEPLSAFT